MQGIFISGVRPKSKKQIKEIARINPEKIYIERTSPMGNDYSGPLTAMPEGTSVAFVGPDPDRLRNFYGTISRKNGKVVVE